MVPDVAGTGHSFKGALAYYLHDKRGDDQSPHLSSSERVEWTETRNLATSDMQTAERVMIATAKRSDDLKREAGIRNTGRKSNAHVYAYSLSWHPSERPDRAEMMRAADETLKALGADNRQAIIVAHTDRAHRHVHVIVNRVDPSDGRMLSTSNDRLKLSDWANSYERGRGNIVTPKREERRQQRQQHADRTQRRDYAAKARIAAQERAHDTGSRIASLKELGAAQGSRHRGEWRDLAVTNKAGRSAIYDQFRAQIKDTAARHKAEVKPIWRMHFRRAQGEDRGFQSREQSLAGRLLNAWEAAKHRQDTGQLDGRGLLGETMRQVFSSEARQEAFAQAQDMTRAELATRLKTILDREIEGVKTERGQALVAQRQDYQTQRAALIERQDSDRAKLSEAWKALKPARERKDGDKPYWRAEQRQQGSERPREAQERQLEGRGGFFAHKDQIERQQAGERPDKAESFFERKERLEREAREKPRDRGREWERDR